MTGCGPFAGSFGQAQFWDAETGALVGPAMRHFGAVSSIAISPDERLVATASFDHSVKIWDMNTSQPVREPLMHHDRVWSVVFSPDGQTLLTSSDDQTAQLWDVALGKPLGPPMKHNAKVRNADFCADNHTIATGALGNSARTWRAPRSWSGDVRELNEKIEQLTSTKLSKGGNTELPPKTIVVREH